MKEEKKLSDGFNIDTEPIKGCGYSTHAEMDALAKLPYTRFGRSLKKREKIDILVICAYESGKLRMSKPCSHCLMQMNKSVYKIRNIYYSDRDGNITCKKLTTLLSEEMYVSTAFRK